MAVLNQVAVNFEFVKVRWQEPYISASVNRKLFGVFPKGIYHGFYLTASGHRKITVGPGSTVNPFGLGYVSGLYDETLGWSIAVHHNDEGYATTISIPPGGLESYELDATGLNDQRVYVVLDVDYQPRENTIASANPVTNAQIKLVTGSEIDANPSLIVIGHVDIPGSAVALDTANMGYNDPSYPRLTPLSSPNKDGLMPKSAWAKLDQFFAWEDILSASKGDSGITITITPSQKQAGNKRIFSYIQANFSSKFPRSATGTYNGGVNDTDLTTLNLETGAIRGAHQIPTNQTFSPPSIIGVANKWQTGLICLDPNDNILVFYSAASASRSSALIDTRFPTASKKLFQVALFVVSTNASGVLNALGTQDILDRRPFLNLGGGGGSGDASELLERFKDQLDASVYRYLTPSVFANDETALVDSSSTGDFDIVGGTFVMSSGETLVTKQLLASDYLSKALDVERADVSVIYDSTKIDTGATYQVSRDGGSTYTSISMERVGESETFSGSVLLPEEVSFSTLHEPFLVSGSTSTVFTSTVRSVAQPITLSSLIVLKQALVSLVKTGSPAGSVTLSLVKDSGGSPSSNPADIVSQSPPVLLSSLSSGTNTLLQTMPKAVVPAGDYHLVIATDSAYASSYVASTTQLAIQSKTTETPVAKTSANGTTWTAGSAAIWRKLLGRTLDLRLKITASASGAGLAAIGVFYHPDSSVDQKGIKWEQKTVTASSNQNVFTVESFVPEQKLLDVIEVDTGKVWVYPLFSVSGQTVTFPAGSFNSASNIRLVFRQR